MVGLRNCFQHFFVVLIAAQHAPCFLATSSSVFESGEFGIRNALLLEKFCELFKFVGILLNLRMVGRSKIKREKFQQGV